MPLPHLVLLGGVAGVIGSYVGNCTLKYVLSANATFYLKILDLSKTVSPNIHSQVTTPTDVMRVRMQACHHTRSPPLIRSFIDIFKTEGIFLHQP